MSLHRCSKSKWSGPITECFEVGDDLWIRSYGPVDIYLLVNFCPFCGYKAKRQIGEPPKPEPKPQPKAPQPPTLNTEFWAHGAEFPWSALSPLVAIREAAQILKNHDCGSPAVAWGTPCSSTETGTITCRGGAGHTGPIHIGGLK